MRGFIDLVIVFLSNNGRPEMDRPKVVYVGGLVVGN